MPEQTWLQREEAAYPCGGQHRLGKAIFPDGRIRQVWAGIADTFFTIPAHAKVRGKYVAGFLTVQEDGEYLFHPYADYEHLFEEGSR